MRNSSWLDTFWLVFSVAAAILAVVQGETLPACIIGFSAGGQVIDFAHKAWWKHVRKLYALDKEGAIRFFERRMKE